MSATRARPMAMLLTLGFVPPRWRMPCFVMLGVFVGLGLATAHVSRAGSYMSDSPEACINCHVMTGVYMAWQRSSHAEVTHCNDCHVPHDGVFHHYSFKARDGARHSTIFTLGREPQVPRLSEGAIPVVEANCRRCHEEVVNQVHLRTWQPGDKRCWDCHREVPHGRVQSLSATSPVNRPKPPPLRLFDNEPKIGGRSSRAETSE